MADPAPIRVCLVDDHALFRRGLDLVLRAEDDIAVVGEAGDGLEAVSMVLELVPDVVVMDVRMPRLDGITATARITEQRPDVRVLVLTVSDRDEDLYAAIRAGAVGYLLKEVSIDEISAAVRAVARGQSLISPSMAPRLLAEFRRLSDQATLRRPAHPRLTDRELVVLRLAGKGLTNREIAGELRIAENTVKNHVRNVLEKLHLHSRTEAVLHALREGLLTLD